MGRAGAWISRDERPVRNDARRHRNATGLISLDRSRSWIPPHRLFVHSLFFAVSQLVSKSTEGRQEGVFLPPPPARPPGDLLSAEPRSRQLRGPALPSRIVGAGLDSRVRHQPSLMSARAHRDVDRRAEAVVLNRA